MTKNNLMEKILRRLGSPMIKIELDVVQISDTIDYAKQKWIKWAAGNATQEVWFTIPLSAGQNFYDVPLGVTEIMGYYDEQWTTGGINTLFTLENYMFNQGVGASLLSQSGDSYSLVSYHIARDFLETLRRYTPMKYNYKYHRYINQIEVHPSPDSGNSLSVTTTAGETTIDSPGYLLMRAMMLQGSTYDDYEAGDSDFNFYGEDWIFDFALAECKILLGRIRNKFAQFASLGNIGIAMDGAELMAEGKEEKLDLLERLQLEEVYEGLSILIG